MGWKGGVGGAGGVRLKGLLKLLYLLGQWGDGTQVPPTLGPQK